MVSGSNATKPGPNTTQAAAVNGAIEALGRALARDLAPQGIRVNVLSPGVVWTDLQLRVSGGFRGFRFRVLGLGCG